MAALTPTMLSVQNEFLLFLATITGAGTVLTLYIMRRRVRMGRRVAKF
jgi:hypothetical protein